MAEKMTAFWLVILTLVICISVPLYMLILTTPSAEFVLSIEENLSTLNHILQNSNSNFN